MNGAILAAFIGLIGVAMGGGMQALQNWRARKLEASSVLSALVSEVEALARLIHHRGFRKAILHYRSQAMELVQAGQGQADFPGLLIPAEHNYFATYDALISKIGLLDPYYADRITRFYTLVKAVHENYLPTSPHQQNATAAERVEHFTSDLMLLDSIMILAGNIASFRKAAPPKGIVDPFINMPTTDGPWDYLNPRPMPIDAPVDHQTQQLAAPNPEAPESQV